MKRQKKQSQCIYIYTECGFSQIYGTKKLGFSEPGKNSQNQKTREPHPYTTRFRFSEPEKTTATKTTPNRNQKANTSQKVLVRHRVQPVGTFRNSSTEPSGLTAQQQFLSLAAQNSHYFIPLPFYFLSY